jgi:hypothetical protein
LFFLSRLRDQDRGSVVTTTLPVSASAAWSYQIEPDLFVEMFAQHDLPDVCSIDAESKSQFVQEEAVWVWTIVVRQRGPGRAADDLPLESISPLLLLVRDNVFIDLDIDGLCVQGSPKRPRSNCRTNAESCLSSDALNCVRRVSSFRLAPREGACAIIVKQCYGGPGYDEI